MIPLSNGRSPRIDQFYATLRAYRSHQLNEEHHNRPDQDRSIQHIRSLGKEIFDAELTHRHNKQGQQLIKKLNKSSESLHKSTNLYDKYKDHQKNKLAREVDRTKQIIVHEQINKSSEKLKTDRKYQQVSSKVSMKANLKLNGLNYEKKADAQAQKLKKEREQTEKLEKQMKQKQVYYEKNTKLMRSSKQTIVSGVLRRTQELQARKQKCAQRIRQEELEKQMSKVTFSPQIFSKQLNTVEPDFQKRILLASSQKILKEKQLIKEVVSSHSFNPQINLYKNSDSKIGKLWRSSKGTLEAPQQGQSPRLKISQSQEEYAYKSQPQTANSTVQINIKNLNEISFIFQ